MLCRPELKSLGVCSAFMVVGAVHKKTVGEVVHEHKLQVGPVHAISIEGLAASHTHACSLDFTSVCLFTHII